MTNYTINTYKEERRPSDDASNVGRWIIGPSLLAAALGGALFGGLAGTVEFTGFPRVFSFLMFGAGLLGLGVMLVRFLTYDKQPFIFIRETTQNPVDDSLPQPEYRGGNNTVNHIQGRDNVKVEYRDDEYIFTPSQMRIMLDRLADNNKIVAQNEFKISPGAEYQKVCKIMAGLDYWQVNKKGGRITAVRWKDSGEQWLVQHTR